VFCRPEVAFRYLPAVRAYALNSTVIYDTVDLHWVRMRRAGEILAILRCETWRIASSG
jgi:hypothetical protein